MAVMEGGEEADGVDRVVDLKGLNCPLPVLKTRRMLGRLAPGTRIRVLATDPMSAIDLPHMCREDGHRLVASRQEERILVYDIERGSGPSR